MIAQTVIGIGASAGGLEALEKLLDGTRPDGRSAYVVVTHLSPDFKSLLDELLKRHTDMSVCVVEEGMQIEVDSVYVIPPNTEMIVMEDRLHLSDRGVRPAQTLPINVFLASLAREYGPRAIAVILSGSGSDGAKGAEAVRAAGGVVIVQDPNTARFDSMPRAAILSCVNARVVKAERIGTIIAGLAGGNEIIVDTEETTDLSLDMRAEALTEILAMIYGVSNVDFSLYKMKTIYRRVRRRMLTNGHEQLSDYLLQLKADENELRVLADDMLITVTEFFRDTEAFDFLEQEIIPELVANSTAARPIRLWSAACSYGQEAYSLAILLYMEARRKGVRIDPQIYATDLREASIQKAGTGVFSGRDLVNLTDEMRQECFERISEDEYRIIQPIRRWMVFAEHNMLRDPPFTRLDFISCRNVLIYFEGAAQRKVLSLLNFGLKDQGILFLGRSETLGDLADDFQTINQTWRVFRKISASAAVSLSVGARLAAIDGTLSKRGGFGGASVPLAMGKPRLGPAYASLIETFIPQGALITNNREVLHLFGDADDFLRAPKGVMDADILKMAPPPLRVPMAAALDRARSEGREIVFPRIKADFIAEGTELSLRVVPLQSSTVSDIKYFFIGLEQQQFAKPDIIEPAVLLNSADLESERVISLERELQVTRENLQATIEEVETSNEELQSTNEELMASNEELQSTNEELQSVNEELYTVNAEYQNKNDELEDVTRDIDNLIASTAIGVIFVDNELHMRRFTDAVSRVLNVAPVDIGRALPDITHRLVDIDLVSLIRGALSERRIKIAETPDQDGEWWQIRVIPLAAQWGKGDGAVITIYEITALRNAQLEAEARTGDLRLIADTTGAHVIHQNPDGSFSTPEAGWTSLSGQRDEATTGFGWIDATHPENHERLKQFWRTAKPAQETVLQTHMRIRDVQDEEYRHLSVFSTPEFNETGHHKGWISVLIDVEDTIQSEHVVRKSERLLDTVLEITPARVSYVDTEKRYRYVNHAYEDAFGIKREDIISKRVDEILPQDMQVQALSNIDLALAGERTEYTIHGTSANGEAEILSVHYEPDIQANGDVHGLAVTVRDITTAFEQIDDQLQQKALIADVLSRSSLAILMMSDVESKITSASAGASRVTGYSAFDLRQKLLSDLIPEYDARRLNRILASQEKMTGDPETFKTFLINRVGDSIDIEFEIVARQGKSPSPVIVFIRDRTASSGTEVALRRRTEELSRSNRMLEVFAAAATHELTSPLRRVAKFSQLLQTDHGDTLPEEASAFLDVITEETDRMRRTINAVVELVRLERMEIEPAPVDLRKITEIACSSLMELIDATGTKIDIGTLPDVFGDPTQLEILFRNLIMNAIIHRHPERSPHIRVDSEEEGQGITLIRVTDNGHGVPPPKQSEIFLPFVRVDGDKDSIGMGLALCRRICEVHHGTLELEKTASSGSSFVVRLPTS